MPPPPRCRAVPLPRCARGRINKIASRRVRPPSPRARGEGRDEGALPLGSERRRRSLSRSLRSRPLPHAGEVKESSRARTNKIVLAALSCARALPTTTTPKKICSRHQRGKRSAERRMPTMSALRRQVNANLRHPSAARLRAHTLSRCGEGRGHARLSALTLAALATGYHPDGSAPEPGFPKTDFASVLPAWPSCLRLSTLRADRSFCRPTGDPEPPGSGLANPRAGTSPRFRLSGLPFRKGALHERGGLYVTETRTNVNRSSS